MNRSILTSYLEYLDLERERDRLERESDLLECERDLERERLPDLKVKEKKNEGKKKKKKKKTDYMELKSTSHKICFKNLLFIIYEKPDIFFFSRFYTGYLLSFIKNCTN